MDMNFFRTIFKRCLRIFPNNTLSQCHCTYQSYIKGIQWCEAIVGKSKKGGSGKLNTDGAVGRKGTKSDGGAGASSTGVSIKITNIDIEPYTDPGKVKPASAVRLVILSDTHGKAQNVTDLPKADILVFCGDHSLKGTMDEWGKFIKCFLRVHVHRFEHIVLIAGNHDEILEKSPECVEAKRMLSNHGFGEKCIYLEDESVTLKGIKIYGSPWSPFRRKKTKGAFQYDPETEVCSSKWNSIPEGIDVLITHSPPHGICDKTKKDVNAGCKELRTIVEKKQPRLHVFGHIHEGYGMAKMGGTTFINSSLCDNDYNIVNKPVIFDLVPPQPPVE